MLCYDVYIPSPTALTHTPTHYVWFKHANLTASTNISNIELQIWGGAKYFQEATLLPFQMKPILILNLCGNCITGIWLVQFTGRAKLTIQNHAYGLTLTTCRLWLYYTYR